VAVAVGVSVEGQRVCCALIDFAIAIVVFTVTTLLTEINDQLADQQPLAGKPARRASPREAGVAEVAHLGHALVHLPVTVVVRTVALLRRRCAYARVGVIAVGIRAAWSSAATIAVNVDAERGVHAYTLRIRTWKDHTVFIHIAIAVRKAGRRADARPVIRDGKAEVGGTVVVRGAGLAGETTSSAGAVRHHVDCYVDCYVGSRVWSVRRARVSIICSVLNGICEQPAPAVFTRRAARP
jgi:hypothetical protein